MHTKNMCFTVFPLYCSNMFSRGWILAMILLLIVSAYRYIAVTNLPIIAVFVEYLRQFLIDLNQIYRHSSVPKNTSTCIF